MIQLSCCACKSKGIYLNIFQGFSICDNCLDEIIKENKLEFISSFIKYKRAEIEEKELRDKE